MGNQQPSTYGHLVDAVVNARLGDGHFWKHPECRNWKLVWTSIHEEWVRWKMATLLPRELRGSVHRRDRTRDQCYPNATPIYTATSTVHPYFTEMQLLTGARALELLSDRGLGMWFLDDGCTVRRNDGGSFRVTLSVGPELSLNPEALLEWARARFQTAAVGRVAKNNSRATEKNKSWVIPKPVAVQIMRMARSLAPPELQYKTPIW